MKGKSWIKLAVVLLLIALVGCLALNGLRVNDFIKNTAISKYIVKPVGEAIGLGLDLKGGISAGYEAEPVFAQTHDGMMASMVAILRERLAYAGYADATVARRGDSGIRVEIPGVENPEEILASIGKRGQIEFRDPDGNVILEGARIASSDVKQDQQGASLVSFQLDKEGTKLFADATAQFLGQTIAVYVDDVEVASPSVNVVIKDGAGAIAPQASTLDESRENAQELAMLIESGALPLDIELTETRAISATLGFGALGGMATAGWVALALIILLLLALYRLPGLAGSISLVIYALLAFYLLAIFRARLTIEGVAGLLLGLVLTVGANAVLFERFREELKAGRTPQNALKFGAKSAQPAILDAVVVLAIVAIALFIFGVGAVRGFAAALLISVLVSLFTSLLCTRHILNWILRLGFKGNGLYSR